VSSTLPERPSVPNNSAGAEPSFEDAVRRLSEIVEKLEDGELPLEDSLKLFEEGVRLARTSLARLDAAERRVEELLGIDEDGNPVVREVESE
jgi:exodeoxyribonuclease VII small subunit